MVRDSETLAKVLEVGLSAENPHSGDGKTRAPMMLIGNDTHKPTHTATAVEPDTNREVASIRIDATVHEYHGILTLAARWPQGQ